MKLHSVVGSPACRKVEAAIRHMGVAIEIEYHDLIAGELKTPSYLAINPAGRVPAFEDGELRLAESNAILVYLAVREQSALFAPDPKIRAQILQWMNFELAHYNRALGAIGFETVIRPALGLGETNAALVEAMHDNLVHSAAVLDGHLEGRSYLVGGDVTLADYALMGGEAFKDAIAFDWTPYPNVNAYYDRMRNNPHVAATALVDLARLGRRPEAA